MPPTNSVSFFNYDTTDAQVATFLNAEEEKYRVFTGADLSAYIGNVRIGKLQGISYSVTRETMPIYTTGDPNCKAFSKGKRGIAGTLVFTQFDRHAILRDLVDTRKMKLQNIWAALNKPGTIVSAQNSNGVIGGSTPVPISSLIGSEATAANIAAKDLLETAYLVSNRKINYVDQIPPFDVTITFVNEMGNASFFAIHGCQLVNEGGGWTVDDLHSETAYTFLARAITPLENYADPSAIGSTSSTVATSF